MLCACFALYQARAALEHLVPGVTRCDPDGITLYFFNSQFEKYEGVQSADDILTLFDQTEPGGGTKLAKVCWTGTRARVIVIFASHSLCSDARIF
jgi:hypothetical protein